MEVLSKAADVLKQLTSVSLSLLALAVVLQVLLVLQLHCFSTAWF